MSFLNNNLDGAVKTVQDIQSKYLCGICRGIIDNATRPDVCSHVFCQYCLFNSYHQSSTKQCPICRKDFDFANRQRETQLDKEILDSWFKCENCDQKIRLKDYNSHDLNCQPVGAASNYQPVITQIPQNRATFKCPYCPQKNLTTQGLLEHCNASHRNDGKKVVCPVCVVMPWGDPNKVSGGFLDHLNLRHQFEYQYFVDYDKSEDEMLKQALLESMYTK